MSGGPTCRGAKELIKSFHACRPGKSGRCPRVAGYRCSENRFNAQQSSYDSKVTCRKGGRTVKHTYTQFPSRRSRARTASSTASAASSAPRAVEVDAVRLAHDLARGRRPPSRRGIARPA